MMFAHSDPAESPALSKDDPMAEYHATRQKYAQQKSKQKGAGRETDTLEMLAKFKTKLTAAHHFASYGDDDDDDDDDAQKEKDKGGKKEEEDDEDDPNDMSW